MEAQNPMLASHASFLTTGGQIRRSHNQEMFREYRVSTCLPSTAGDEIGDTLEACSPVAARLSTYSNVDIRRAGVLATSLIII